MGFRLKKQFQIVASIVLLQFLTGVWAASRGLHFLLYGKTHKEF